MAFNLSVERTFTRYRCYQSPSADQIFILILPQIGNNKMLININTHKRDFGIRFQMFLFCELLVSLFREAAKMISRINLNGYNSSEK